MGAPMHLPSGPKVSARPGRSEACLETASSISCGSGSERKEQPHQKVVHDGKHRSFCDLQLHLVGKRLLPKNRYIRPGEPRMCSAAAALGTARQT